MDEAYYSPSPEFEAVGIAAVLKDGEIAAFGLGNQHFEAGEIVSGHC